MAPRDPSVFGGARCQEPATHDSIFGRLCDPCAERLRERMRDPATTINQAAGRRARTEYEITLLVRRLA